MKKLETFIVKDSTLIELKKRLSIEFELKDKSGIYALTSKRLAYNSNKIEGTSLTPDHTDTLFTEGYLDKDDIYKIQEVEEMQGHFLMFNYMITILDEKLSEEIIKKMQYELKIGVFHDRTNGYNIGDYKGRENFVGDLKTTSPENVSVVMKELLDWYHSQEDVTLETLAEFHIKYERIHPFQDGNGRTGRLILFKESLCNGITPFIIRDVDRISYIKALKEHDVQGLVTVFADCQTEYIELLDIFFN